MEQIKDLIYQVEEKDGNLGISNNQETLRKLIDNAERNQLLAERNGFQKGIICGVLGGLGVAGAIKLIGIIGGILGVGAIVIGIVAFIKNME